MMSQNPKIDNGQVDVVDIVRKVLPDGTLLEAIYNQETEEAKLVVVEEDNWEIANQFQHNGHTYRPFVDNHIRSGSFIKWPSDVDEPGNGQELLEDVQEFIHDVYDLPEVQEIISARYVLASYFFDKFDHFGYLRILGDTNTGKTTFLNVMKNLCYRGVFLGGSFTEAVIYRIMSLYPGALFMDELDLNDSSLRSLAIKILNAGYQKDGVVWRCGDGSKGYIPEAFPVYGPKCIAARFGFDDDALESRILNLKSRMTMRRNLPSLSSERIEKRMQELRNRLFGYRIQNWHKIDGDARVLGLEEFDNRTAEILRPMSVVLNESEVNPYVLLYARQLTEDRYASLQETTPAIIIRELSMATEKGERLLVGQLAERANPFLDPKDQMSARKLGAYLDSLGIERKDTSRGREIIVDANHLEQLMRKYGFRRNPGNVDAPLEMSMMSTTFTRYQ